MPAASIGRRTDMFFQIEGYTRFLLNPPNQTKGARFKTCALSCNGWRGNGFYLAMTPFLAIDPSQSKDGFGWRSKVSLSQEARPNVGANEPHS